MLTSEELEYFIRDGFLLKKSVLSEQSRMICLQETWDVLSIQGITKDPTSWSNAHNRRGVIKLRDELDDRKSVHDAILGCTQTEEIVASLMGDDFTNCGVRGIYPTLPIPRRISRMYEPHIENHPCQVVVMFYLDNVTERNGGLLVWPGSHRPVYLSHQKKFDFSPTEKFLDVFQTCNKSAPIEVTGNAGDALFFHHRLFHSGSNNFSSRIRFGLLNDFIPNKYEQLRGERPTEDSMWNDWSEAIQDVAKSMPDHSALSQAKSDSMRSVLVGLTRMTRRLKGSFANEYEERMRKT